MGEIPRTLASKSAEIGSIGMTRRIAAIGSSLGISPRITKTGAGLDTFLRHPSKSHLQFVGSFNSLMCDLHAIVLVVVGLP